MLSHLLSFLLALSQQVNENTSGLKFLLGVAGIASMFAMLQEMRKNGKTAKQKMSKAQRKEMRKLNWKMRWMMLKKFFGGDGKGRFVIVIIILIGSLIGAYILAGWWLVALILLIGIYAMKEVDE